MNDGAEPRFAVPLRRAMRREGLAGSKAEVRLDGDSLLLAGDSGGSVRVRAGEVDRIRIATLELPPSRHSRGPPTTLYEARIWRTGKRARLLIGPPMDRPGDYRRVIREFAGWVFADGGEVFRGPGAGVLVVRMAWAIVPPTVFGLLLLGGAIVEGLAWLWGLAAFILLLPFFLVPRLYRRHWPRRVSRPEELDEVLPPPEEAKA